MRNYWTLFRKKLAKFFLPSHLEVVEVLSSDLDWEEPPKQLAKKVPPRRPRAAPSLIGAEPVRLEDFGLGTGWVAEHNSGMGGLGGCRGRVYTKGFNAEHLYVFDTSEDAQGFIKRMGFQNTHYAVCHEWAASPPLKWKSQWGGNA
jgi:hypothetical protein